MQNPKYCPACGSMMIYISGDNEYLCMCCIKPAPLRQSKKYLFESLANIAVGYGVAIIGQLAIFPCFGFHPPLRDNLAIGLCFTVVSLVRSYVLRRIFNRIGR